MRLTASRSVCDWDSTESSAAQEVYLIRGMGVTSCAADDSAESQSNIDLHKQKCLH